MAGYKGKQGRKAKPSTIVERLRDQDRTPTLTRLPRVPDHLSPIAQAEWTRMGRHLIKAGLLDTLDLTALEMYADAYARWTDAKRMLDGPIGKCPNCDPRLPHPPDPPMNSICIGARHIGHEYGTVVRNRRGALVTSPYVKIANDAWAQMKAILGDFGMTPASRMRVTVQKASQSKGSRRVAPARSEQDEDPRAIFKVVEGGKQ